MKITIIGAGAIGGVIGAYLAKGGKDVELVDIDQEHIAMLKDKGLKIISQEKTLLVPVKAYTPDQLLGKKDTLECILLCVKAQHTVGALKPLLSLMNKETFVVSVQNGLCELEIAEIVGESRTIGGFVNIFADYIKPGVINYGGKGALSIGELDGSVTTRIKELEQEMSVLDRIEVSTNITGYLWSKLAYGAILTATALTNEKMADIIDSSRYRVMLMDMAAEVLAVAHGIGVATPSFDDWDPADAYPREARDLKRMNTQLDIHVKRLRTYSKVHSGIWRDIAVRKRKTEKPYHFVPIFKLADGLSIEMPLCKLLLKMLEEIENEERAFSVENLEIMLNYRNKIYEGV